jgi:glycosyltransferase involved in cell wall biosynthesis
VSPRLLWVTPEVPDRNGGGGAIRQAELLTRLRGRFDIDLLVSGVVRDEVVRTAVDNVVELPVEERMPGRLGAAWQVAVRRAPLFVAGSARSRAVLGEALRPLARAYDAVLLHHEELLPLLADCGPALRVLHVFDIKSVRADQSAEAIGAGRRAWIRRAEGRASRRQEAAWLGEADLLVTCTIDDLALLEDLAPPLGAPGVVVPNGVDLDRFAPTPRPGAHKVLFLGSLDYEPNLDGVTWFAAAVWPRIREAVPEATFTIAGHRPPPAVRALAAVPGIEVIGPVPDAPQCYSAHDLVVVPLRIGTGSRLKALEAMASARPTVGTTIGLEGLDLPPPEGGEAPPALVADDPAGLSAAVVELLRDPARADAVGAAGRAHVARFGWDGIAERLGAALDEALAERGDDEVAGTSVLVCTRGRPELLRTALESVAAALDERDELLVVEADGAGAADLVHGLSPAARHLVAARAGKSRQLNQGLRAASRPIVVMTDDDCRVAPGWVAAMAAPFADPSVGAVFGNVAGLSGLAEDPPPPLPPGLPPAVTWEYANGAAMAVRRSAALALGGFDERLGPGAPVHGEEHDLVLRLLDAGWQVRIADAPAVEHLEWRDPAATRENLLVYSRGAGAFVGLAVRRHPRAGLRLLARRARYQATLWRRARAEGWGFGPASTAAFARGLLHGLRLKPMDRRQLP